MRSEARRVVGSKARNRLNPTTQMTAWHGTVGTDRLTAGHPAGRETWIRLPSGLWRGTHSRRERTSPEIGDMLHGHGKTPSYEADMRETCQDLALTSISRESLRAPSMHAPTPNAATNSLPHPHHPPPFLPPPNQQQQHTRPMHQTWHDQDSPPTFFFSLPLSLAETQLIHPISRQACARAQIPRAAPRRDHTACCFAVAGEPEHGGTWYQLNPGTAPVRGPSSPRSPSSEPKKWKWNVLEVGT